MEGKRQKGKGNRQKGKGRREKAEGRRQKEKVYGLWFMVDGLKLAGAPWCILCVLEAWWLRKLGEGRRQEAKGIRESLWLMV